MEKLITVDAETLLYRPLVKPDFVLDGLIPSGLSLFCGTQKIGKSWLILKLCLQLSKGEPMWGIETKPCTVLYLALEDPKHRLQTRLFKLTNEASERLHITNRSKKITDGLIEQLEDFVKTYPDTKLIVIDTLKKVRESGKESGYDKDYDDISALKEFADNRKLAVLVVHHTRKQTDPDVFNKVSGTTGLTGSADTTFVLEKESRSSDTAKLYAVGRDIDYQELTLRFKDFEWELLERKGAEELIKLSIPPVLFRLVDFMLDKVNWKGTATELLTQMNENEVAPNVITKLLNEYSSTFLSENKIRYDYARKSDGRQIILTKCDSNDSCDGNFGIPQN